MSEAWSKHLNAIQLRSLERIGELYLPAHDDLPGFAAIGCLEHVDVVLDEVHPDDRFALGLFLYVLRITPLFLLEKFIGMMDHHDRYPEPLAGVLRLLSLALKGIVMSVYYSGMTGSGMTGSGMTGSGMTGAWNRQANPLDVIEYAIHCEPDAH